MTNSVLYLWKPLRKYLDILWGRRKAESAGKYSLESTYPSLGRIVFKDPESGISSKKRMSPPQVYDTHHTVGGTVLIRLLPGKQS